MFRFQNTIYIFFALLFTLQISAQVEKPYSLTDVIELAQEQSLDAFISKNLYLSDYWQFRAFQAERRPWLEFSSAPGSYTNSIETITDINGTYLNRTEKLQSSGNLSLSQSIMPTGGRLSLYSNLNRLEDYRKSSDNIYFGSSPVSIALSQPIFQYNPYRWKKKLEPLKFEIAKLEYIESAERIARNAINQFFNLLDAQQAYKIAELNKMSADTIYHKSLGRYERGAIAYNDLQRLELNMLNAQIAFERSNLELERSKFNLKSFLRIPEEENMILTIPDVIPSTKIVPQEALSMALENNPDILEYQKRIIEAEQEVSRAKGQNGINSQLEANLGWSKAGTNIEEVYQDFDKDRGVKLSLYIPIVDWSMSKGQREMAKSNREVETARVEIDRINFEQEIIMSAIWFNMLESQVENASKANAISEKTYKIIEERFLLGKENLETLYSARNERDNALRSYYGKLREYWAYYFYLRQITLYDFEKGTNLTESFDKAIGLDDPRKL